MGNTNLFAVQPFSRTGFGAAMMQNKIGHHKLNFDYGKESISGPSQQAIDMKQKQDQA